MPAPHRPTAHGAAAVRGNGAAVAPISASTSAGVRAGLADSTSAATAATCGAAIEVPS